MKVNLATESTTVNGVCKGLRLCGSEHSCEDRPSRLRQISPSISTAAASGSGRRSGPEGLINMKGARSSQNVSLVNNADVTVSRHGQSDD